MKVKSEKWKWSCSVVPDFSRPHGLQPPRLLCPWDFPGTSTRVGCHCLLLLSAQWALNVINQNITDSSVATEWHQWAIVIYSLSRVWLFCDPMDCGPPGASVRGISQAVILEWLPFLPPGDLPDPGIKPVSPALAGRFFTTEPPGKPTPCQWVERGNSYPCKTIFSFFLLNSKERYERSRWLLWCFYVKYGLQTHFQFMGASIRVFSYCSHFPPQARRRQCK